MTALFSQINCPAEYSPANPCFAGHVFGPDGPPTILWPDQDRSATSHLLLWLSDKQGGILERTIINAKTVPPTHILWFMATGIASTRLLARWRRPGLQAAGQEAGERWKPWSGGSTCQTKLQRRRFGRMPGPVSRFQISHTRARVNRIHVGGAEIAPRPDRK